MKKIGIITKDIFDNDEKGREYFKKCFAIANKYGLVDYTIHNGTDIIVLGIKGLKSDCLRYYIETLNYSINGIYHSIKRIISILLTF